MKYTQRNDSGIGVVAMLVIVAVIGVGGFAAVQVYNQQKVSVDTEVIEEESQNQEEMLGEVRSDARDALLEARVALRTDLNSALSILTDARDALASLYVTVDATAQAELDEIDDLLADAQANVEADLRSGTSEAEAAFDEVLSDLMPSITVDSDNEASTELSEDEEQGMDSESSNEQMDEEGSSIEINSDVSADTSGEIGEGLDVEGSSETQVDGEVNL